MTTPYHFASGESGNDVKLNTYEAAILELQETTFISSWIDVAYGSGWGTVAGQQKLQVRYSTTTAWLRGVIQTTAAVAANAVIGTVPLAARPGGLVQTFIMHTPSGTALTPVRMDIQADGDLVVADAWAISKFFFMEHLSWGIG